MRVSFLAILLLVTGCSQPDVADISADELLGRTTGDALILDVRTAEEFAAGHVPGAVNIPHTQVGARLTELGDDRARPVVVYCESGRRAGMAADVLLNDGYTSVLHLAGDMGEWRAEGRPMVTP
jgi:rhodanese-related sulfurtransferase